MKKIFALTCVVAVVGLTSACEGDRSFFGGNKKAPDEFAVYSRAPLSIPPEFGLRPPRPGATRPQVVAPRNDARKALLGASAVPLESQTGNENLSPGMLALLKETGADQAEPEIRTLVNRETYLLSGGGDKNFVDNILFWRKDATLQGAVINPEVEDRQIRVKKSGGEAVSDQTPTIQRSGGGQSDRDNGKSKGFWGSLFD
ncbi:MAG TPA: DUF3035 domain-containing protein [Rhodospirillales bacterium]|nr:DUF3035 domain-containing protein [Rhodospirillales bacterium]